MLTALFIALSLLAPLAETQDDADAERALLRQALTLLSEQPMSEDVVEAYKELHGRSWRLGDAETAHAAIDRIVAWWEQEYGEHKALCGNHLNDLGNLLLERGDYAGARPLYERSLAIREAELGPEHTIVATSLNNLAVVLTRLGDYAGAWSLYERSLAIRENVHGPEHLLVAESLNNLAVLLRMLGDLVAARPLVERSLAIREELLGSEHTDVATSLNSLASLLRDLGDFAAAQPLYERALAIWVTQLGPEHRHVAAGLNNLAVLLWELGDLAEARSLYERALAILEAEHGPGHVQVAAVLGNLGNLLSDLGDHAAARQLHERCLAIREKALGPSHTDVALSLHNLGNQLRLLGDSVAARPLHARALAIQEAELGPGHADVARSLNSLGLALCRLGDVAGARPLYERALAILEAALGPEHPNVAASLGNLANLIGSLGDHAEAQPLYERSLAVREATWGPGHRSVVQVLYSLAKLHLDLGEPELAQRYARRIAGRRGRVRETLASLTEGERYLYLASQRQLRNTLLAAAAAAGDPTAAYAAVLESKGQVARLTLQTRSQIREAMEPEILTLAESLAQVQSRLSRAALKTDVRNREAHEALLLSLRGERDAVDRELLRTLDASEEAAVTPLDVAAALPPSAAIVDLLVHETYIPARFEDGAFVEVGHWSKPHVSAWIVRASEDRVIHIDLGPAAAIEAAVAAFLEDLVRRRGAAIAGEQSGREVNAELRALVWEPLVSHLDGVQTVFLSPDGVLGTLPFETIQGEDGRFLLEDYAFVYPTEVASMVERPEEVALLGNDASSLLAVGGVDFRRRPAMNEKAGSATEKTAEPGSGSVVIPSDSLRGSFTDYWGRLPATAYESQVVKDMHEDAFLATTTRLLLQGPEASEERLKAEMPRHAILHLATHGFFQPEGLPSMWEQALDAVSGEQGMQLTLTGARLTGLHPGLLSGLVLAGANSPIEDGAVEADAAARDDGYLTASEVTLLNLSAAELVVLSACETGLGRPQSGEGLLGLRRAFHMAGADTVISSLWSVKDESTSELMQSFYANLFLKGMGRHEALRTAQLAMLRQNRMEHGAALPSSWGAFVLSGEWR
jgi:CHAT domain-containing protein/tetratricopeptide (TPR) repeat protein